MSLLGKILALFNIFGAVGLVVMATMDYGKRQSWAYSLARHQLVLLGLPLDEKEQAANGAEVAGLFGDASLGQIFNQPVEGPPVSTQLQEVNRVKQELDAKIAAAAANKRAQAHLLARILLPVPDARKIVAMKEIHAEREQLLACRWHLATDARMAAMKKRYVDAFREAVKSPLAVEGEGKPQTFEDAFRTAIRIQGGQPSEAFTVMMVKALPSDREKAKAVNIEAEFDKVFEDQRKQLEINYNDLFAAALLGPVPDGVRKAAQQADAAAMQGNNLTDEQKQLVADKRRPVEIQKASIARLLFGLCLFRAEEAINAAPTSKDGGLLRGLPRDEAAFGVRLPDTDAYRNMVKRVHIVCGLRASLDAISAQSVVIRGLSDYLVGTVSDERQLFIADHSALVEQIRQAAARVQLELAHKVESERKFGVQEEQVKKRTRDVKELNDDLTEARSQTADRIKLLRELSQKLLDDRVAARDLIRKTEESEKTIRELEKKIRELESRDD